MNSSVALIMSWQKKPDLSNTLGGGVAMNFARTVNKSCVVSFAPASTFELGIYLTPSEFARRCADSGRVGAGDCSPEPLTEPDLWAHIRLFKLTVSKQLQLFRGPHRVKVVPTSTQTDQAFGEPRISIRFVNAEARTAFPVTTNSIGRFPGQPAGNTAT